MSKCELMERIVSSVRECREDPRGALYLAHNEETGKYYLGATSRSATRRVQEHNRALERGVHANPKLQAHFEESPEFEWSVHPVATAKEAFDAERTLLKQLREDPHCLNIRGGAGYSPEVNAKRAESNRGKKHSEETKELLREAATKQWSSEEARATQAEKRREYFKTHTPYQTGIKRDAECCSKVKEGVTKFLEGLTPEEKAARNAHRLAHQHTTPVMVGNRRYVSRKEAALAEGVSPPTVTSRIQSANFPDWKAG